jgi:flagellar biosynthesis protein FlhA
MAVPVPAGNVTPRSGRQDVGFAVGIVFILTVLFLPLPPILLDMGLSFSIALSVLILMVALWIQRPLDFSALPTRMGRRGCRRPAMSSPAFRIS